MIKTSLLCAAALVLVPSCANTVLPSSSPSSPPAQAAAKGPAAPPAGVAEAQAESGQRDSMESELATIDAALLDLRARVGTARVEGRESLDEGLAALQKRAEELKRRIRATAVSAGEEAERARREVHIAVMDLRVDVLHLADRIRQ